MSDTIKQWLKRELSSVVNVQAISLATENADLLIQLWTGVRVHIHLLKAPPKPRAIKRILQEATSAGIGTLFLVPPSLIPNDGERLMPPDWLLAIHTLTSERIYVYGMDRQGKPGIFQVHFAPLNGQEGYETCYGPRIDVERLRFFKLSTKLRMIKGDWLVADFINPAFWKDQNYRSARAQAQQAHRQQRRTHWHEWSTYQTWSSSDQTEMPYSSKPIQDYLHTCYQKLGVSPGADADTVKRAFRQQAMRVHPDVSALPKPEAEARFKSLSEAYEYIKAANGWT